MRPMFSRSRHPAGRIAPALSALAAATLLALPGLAGAQSLQNLFEAARAYDATYLAARSLAESARFKANQVEAVASPRWREVFFIHLSGDCNSAAAIETALTGLRTRLACQFTIVASGGGAGVCRL